jgi:hypothetical protein
MITEVLPTEARGTTVVTALAHASALNHAVKTVTFSQRFIPRGWAK